MPVKTGKECLVEIRNLPSYNEVPVIILSTSARKTEIDFCMNNGANHYFIKPTSYKGIISIVTNLCNGDLYI
jgi:CheY-like chemotaxis protein